MSQYPKIEALLKEHPNKILTTIILFAHEVSHNDADFELYLEQFGNITEPLTVEIIANNLQYIEDFEAYLDGGMEAVEKLYEK